MTLAEAGFQVKQDDKLSKIMGGSSAKKPATQFNMTPEQVQEQEHTMTSPESASAPAAPAGGNPKIAAQQQVGLIPFIVYP